LIDTVSITLIESEHIDGWFERNLVQHLGEQACIVAMTGKGRGCGNDREFFTRVRVGAPAERPADVECTTWFRTSDAPIPVEDLAENPLLNSGGDEWYFDVEHVVRSMVHTGDLEGEDFIVHYRT
jgi:hypothetical protein